jgi:hypothetical protein
MQEQTRPLLFLHSDRQLESRVREASGDRFRMSKVKDWGALKESLQGAPPAALVLVDPFYGGRSRRTPSSELKEVLSHFPLEHGTRHDGHVPLQSHGTLDPGGVGGRGDPAGR